ncbi:MAG: hypothetical protein PHH30_06890 [Bacteroidales bacterium]|nr:hypothetical protein [Bacteroidales bacterium]
MNNLNKKLVILTSLFSLLFFTFCTDQYENHALAFMNNTNDSIQVDRYYSQSNRARSVTIAAGEYGSFYETSSDLWITPQVEMQKICDSIIITGKVNDKEFRIKFKNNDVQNYCNSPFSDSADWEEEVNVEEASRLFGKTLEYFYIHIYNINPACITVIE